jgi:hypothetical protein
MHTDSRVSLILGRPFLSTANARINVGGGKIIFEINGKEEKFAFRPRSELSINANMIDQGDQALMGAIQKVLPREAPAKRQGPRDPDARRCR